MQLKACLLLALAVAFAAVHVSGQSDSFSVATCAAGSYFDTPSLQCGECGNGVNNKQVNSLDVDALGNTLSCRCAPGFLESPQPCDTATAAGCTAPTCGPCSANGTVASQDGSRCMPCDGTTALLNSGGTDCTCAVSDGSHVLVETTATGAPLPQKVCAACPNGTLAFPNGAGAFPASSYECRACSDPRQVMQADGTCACPSSFTLAGLASMGSTFCLPTATRATVVAAVGTATTARLLTWYDVQEPGGATKTVTGADSILHGHWFEWAAVTCWAWAGERDNPACATLAHLCVLQLYDDSTAACRLFTSIANTRGGAVHGWAGWASTLPFLYYSASPSAVLTTTTLAQDYAFRSVTEKGSIETLNLVVARYNLTGHLQSIQPLTGEFSFCIATDEVVTAGSPSWLRFGYSASQTISCDLQSLTGLPLHFYELFIIDTAGTENADERDPASLPYRLYPVPVRITNLRSNGGTPNTEPDTSSTSDDVLVRRFTLVDAQSGVAAVGSTPAYVRYASTIVVSIESQPDDPDKITPPAVSITYKVRQANLFAADSGYARDSVSLHAVYSSDNAAYWDAVTAILAISTVFTAFLTILRFRNWWTRNLQPDELYTFGTVALKGFLSLAGAFSHVTFIVLWMATTYWLLFFKLQDGAFRLMPVFRPDFKDPGYATLEAFIWLVWVGQLLRISDILLEQCSVDVFYIDWEKRKGPLMNTALLEGYDDIADAAPGAAGKIARQPTHPGAGRERKPSARTMRGSARGGELAPRGDVEGFGTRHKYAPVSVWRKLFMANEWSELQADRRIRLWLTLLVMVVIMETAGVKYVGVARPGTLDLSPDVINPALQFANNAFWWYVIAISQYILVWGILERFVSEPPTLRYLDLCTVAKISIICLPHKYAGFYLHCDAPYEFADCTMAQMTDHLQDESGSVLVGRGLPGAPTPDAQQFEVHLPQSWRLQFDAIYRQFNTQVLETAANSRRARGRPGAGGSIARSRASETTGLDVDAAKGRPAYERAANQAPGDGPSMAAVTAQGQAAADALGVRATSLKDERDVAVTKVLEIAGKTLSGFLKAFITEEGSSGIKHVFRSKDLVQRLAGFTPDMREVQQSHGITTTGGMSASGITGVAVMYHDINSTWESVMFRGVEWDLVLWDFLMYSVVDFYTQSPPAAALTTLIFGYALDQLRTQWGQANISRKTLIDDRFLD